MSLSIYSRLFPESCIYAENRNYISFFEAIKGIEFSGIETVEDVVHILGSNLENVGEHFREPMIDQLEEMAEYYDVNTWQEALLILADEKLPEWKEKYEQMGSGSFIVYRWLKLPMNNGKPDFSLLKKNSFGQHWTTDMNFDKQYIGGQPRNNNWGWVAFYANVTNTVVNWPDTICANFTPTGESDEQEVVIKSGTRLKLGGYYIGDVDGNWTKHKLNIPKILT